MTGVIMKQSSQLLLYKLLIILIAGLILIAGCSPDATIDVQAQGANLLTNPSFEGNYIEFPGDRLVANGWTAWHIPGDPNSTDFTVSQPTYRSAKDGAAESIVPRVRSGEDAQVYFSFFEIHDGGLFQRVEGVPVGATLEFSVFAYVWSSTFVDPDVSELPGEVTLSVGIDPTGGETGNGPTAEYSAPNVTYDSYTRYTYSTVAQSEQVTVFVRSIINAPVRNTYIYLDDASLVVREPGEIDATAVVEVTDVPTAVEATAEVTSDATEVGIVPTDVSTTTPDSAIPNATSDVVDLPTATIDVIVLPTEQGFTLTPDGIIDPAQTPVTQVAVVASPTSVVTAELTQEPVVAPTTVPTATPLPPTVIPVASSTPLPTLTPIPPTPFRTPILVPPTLFPTATSVPPTVIPVASSTPSANTNANPTDTIPDSYFGTADTSPNRNISTTDCNPSCLCDPVADANANPTDAIPNGSLWYRRHQSQRQHQYHPP